MRVLESFLKISGFRQVKDDDFPAVTRILNDYLQRYKLRQHFSEDEVRHFLTPRERLVYVYVVEGPTGDITDFCSFYCLPSSILNNHEHSELCAAFM
jgi:glycylpeptide N-tetradecanoyltransferase